MDDSAFKLPKATRPFVIRDPVHGYLVVAAHERILVDDPVTQRLRRIAQTGLTEYVFPEARTSRFVHSLGAMHVASRFVLACLENAQEDTALRFFDEIDAHFSLLTVPRTELDSLLEKEGVLSALSAVRVFFHQSKLQCDHDRYRRLFALVEAGVRLAALFHDLGHLPFSHDFEYALQDYASKQKASAETLPDGLKKILGEDAPHEAIGHRLAEFVLQTLAAKQPGAVRAVFEMAHKILQAPKPRRGLRGSPSAGALEWLHSIVDGEIDADRADFVLRDGKALGLDFAHYDLDRLATNLELRHEPRWGFVTAVREQGLSALESYCLSRSRSTQVFIRHHKVAQIAAALRYVSVQALKRGSGTSFLNLLNEIGSASASDESKASTLLTRFAMYDDAWWIETLKAQDSGSDKLFQACRGLVQYRNRSLRSLWKRKGELDDTTLASVNTLVDESFASAEGKIALAERRQKLLEFNTLIVTHKFKPYATMPNSSDSLMLVITPKGLQPASKMSPLINSLTDMWNQDVHLHAFALQDSAVSKEDVIKVLIG